MKSTILKLATALLLQFLIVVSAVSAVPTFVSLAQTSKTDYMIMLTATASDMESTVSELIFYRDGAELQRWDCLDRHSCTHLFVDADINESVHRYRVKAISNDMGEKESNEITAVFSGYTPTLPLWSNPSASPASHFVYDSEQEYLFGIDWQISGVNEVLFESNFTGIFENESMVYQYGDHYYYSVFSLDAGTYQWRSHASDTNSHSNVSDWQEFVVEKADAEMTLTLNGVNGDITIERNDIVNAIPYFVEGETAQLSLYRDSTLLQPSPIGDYWLVFNETGTYEMRLEYPGTGNYNPLNVSHSVIVEDTVAPGPISGLAASNVTYYSIAFEWVNPTDEDFNHTVATLYQGTAVVESKTVDSSSSSVEFTGLAYNTGYAASFVAYDRYGNPSAAVASGTVTTLADTEAPLWSNASPANGTTVVYDPAASYQFNVTWEDRNMGAVQIYHDFTGVAVAQPVTGNVGNVYYFNYASLPAGDYEWYMDSTDTAANTNTTDVFGFTVEPVVSACTLSFDVPLTIAYGTPVNASCSCTSPEANAVLLRDSVDVTATENNLPVILMAGNYSYECSVAETQNYTSASGAANLTVELAVPSVNFTLNGFESGLALERLGSVDFVADILTGEAAALNLYENGILVTALAETVPYNVVYSDNGLYEYVLEYVGTANYQPLNITRSVTVADAVAPGPIFNMIMGAITGTSIDFSWTNPADDDFNRTVATLYLASDNSTVDSQEIDSPGASVSFTGLGIAGSYWAAFETYDHYGNTHPDSTVTSGVFSTLDTLGPEISSGVYFESVYSPSLSVVISADISDNVGVDAVVFELDLDNSTAVTYLGSAIYSVNLTGLSAGVHGFVWYANDTAGNMSSLSGVINITRASSAVDLKLEGADSGVTVLEGSDVNISAELLAGEDGITVDIDASNLYTGAAPWSQLVNFPTVGSYNITLTYPQSENYSESSELLVVNVIPIVRNVSVSVDSAWKGTTNTANAQFTVTVQNTGNIADDYTVSLVNTGGADTALLNGSPIYTIASLAPAASEVITLEVGDAVLGDYNVTVNAVSDTDGSVSDSVLTTTTVADTSEVIDSTVAGVYYASGNYSVMDIPQLLGSGVYSSVVDALSRISISQLFGAGVANSNVTANSEVNNSDVSASEIDSSDIISGSVVSGSEVLSSAVSASSVSAGSSVIAGSNIDASTLVGAIVTASAISASSSVDSSYVDVSTLVASQIRDSSDISNSTVTNSDLTRCTVIDSVVDGLTASDCFIDPSNVTNTTISGNTNITDSNVSDSSLVGASISLSSVDGSDILYSDVTSSTVADSTVSANSVVTSSTVTSSTVSDSDVTGSTITNGAYLYNVTSTNSNVDNTSIENVVLTNANLTDGIFVSGTITLPNGTDVTGSGQNVLNLINYAPNAVISASATTITVGGSVTFTSASTDPNPADNGNLTFDWDFADGTNHSNESVVSHTFSSTGTFVVVLTVADDEGASDNETVTITVNAVSQPSSGGSSGGSSRSSDSYYKGATYDIGVAEGGMTSLTMLEKDTFLFNYSGENHSITVLDINNIKKEVKLKVSSDPVEIIVKEGQQGGVNLDTNLNHDVFIRVDKITSSNTAIFTISLRGKEQAAPAVPAVQPPVQPSSPAVQPEPEPQEDVVEQQEDVAAEEQAETGSVVGAIFSLPGKVWGSFASWLTSSGAYWKVPLIALGVVAFGAAAYVLARRAMLEMEIRSYYQ